MKFTSKFFCRAVCFGALSISALAQGRLPYPNAITDRLLHDKTPMAPTPARTVFTDPDFGSSMVRVTDQTTNPRVALSYFYNPSSGALAFNTDTTKFFLVGEHGIPLAFGFDPTSMAIHSLPGAGTGGALQLPFFGGETTFSSTDPDLIFGVGDRTPLTVFSYRFSTAASTPIFNAPSACATNPPISPTGTSNDLYTSVDDNRIVLAAGGTQFGNRTVVVVYDRKLGCRWYNTATGQIGGQWGTLGTASVPGFKIRHVAISGNGRYVKISQDKLGFYFWDIATLNVTVCLHGSVNRCDGYGSMGLNTYINESGVIDEMNLVQRPMNNITAVSSIYSPFPLPHYWSMILHPSWSNARFDGDNAPICGSTYSPTGVQQILQPFDGEIFCMETDGVASTIWRFAHDRSVWNPTYYWTDSLGNASDDGRFFMFSSTWDGQVGLNHDADPRSDVWLVKLR